MSYIRRAIDEVQKEISVLEEIKLIVDKSDSRGYFILSGSQKLELMKGVSESLAGKVAVMELAGLSLRETSGITFTKFMTAVAARSGETLNYANVASEVGVSEIQELNPYFIRNKFSFLATCPEV